jgi:toxin ParE1/3/4
MAHRVVLSERALQQLDSIFRYIEAAANVQTAADFVDLIVAHCEGFDKFPLRGSKRDEVRPGLRIVGFRKRVTIAFHVTETTVNILGIFYGGQDVEGALSDDASDNP